jgi:hypothetical protein
MWIISPEFRRIWIGSGCKLAFAGFLHPAGIADLLVFFVMTKEFLFAVGTISGEMMGDAFPCTP